MNYTLEDEKTTNFEVGEDVDFFEKKGGRGASYS